MSAIRIHRCVAWVFVLATSVLTATAAEGTNKLVETPSRPDYWPWTFGIEGGSLGIFGAFGKWRFSDHVGVGVACDFTEDNESGQSIGGTDYDIKARLLNQPLTLDAYPWKKHSFHVSFGWLFNQNQVTGTASHENGMIIIDNQPFPIQDVGELHLKMHQQEINPYLSFGMNLLYFDHAHHWALGAEIGVAYTGDPQVSLVRTGPPSTVIDAAVNEAQKRAQDYADQYRWYPVAKLSLSYSF